MAADIKEVLKPDNKVARILTRVCDMAVLNIVWLLTSVFLVTIGPSNRCPIHRYRKDAFQYGTRYSKNLF